MTPKKPGFTRRQFLQLTGATGVVVVPTALGYGVLRASEGGSPPHLSPYATPGDPPSGLPAAPILLLTNDAAENTFGSYLAEVLRTEGLHAFRIAPVSSIDATTMGQFPLVLLCEGPLRNAQVELLEGYVAGGGRLIAMRPAASLARLFGVEVAAGSTSDGYVKVAAGHPAAQGIVAEAMQFHGTADRYRLAGAQAVAWLADASGAQSDYAAVTLHASGQGQAALWAFDLARSLALTRQGNPAWSNQERDGRDGIRAHDAFVGWIDLDRIAIPQADEQMRLLSQLLCSMLADVLPVPRLWYFPDSVAGMLIATGDAHLNPAPFVDDVLRRVEAHGGHMTIYYSPQLARGWRRAVRRARWWAAELPIIGTLFENAFSFPTPSQVTDWRARGHEFALHPYVEEGLEVGWQKYWNEFTGLGYSPVPPTVRTHRILWTGWVETARAQASYGMRMNLDYYHHGPSFQKDNGDWVYGYFTGSGLPMKFIDEAGRLLSVYQQITPLADEHLLVMPWGLGGSKLSGEEAVEVSRAFLRRMRTGAPSAIAAQFHVDPFAYGGEYADNAGRWMEGTLDIAVEQGFPIWAAQDWLRFTEVRHDAEVSAVQWSAQRLSFELAAESAPDVALTLMIPLQHGDRHLAGVEVDGVAAGFAEHQWAGLRYGAVTLKAGQHRVTAAFA